MFYVLLGIYTVFILLPCWMAGSSAFDFSADRSFGEPTGDAD